MGEDHLDVFARALLYLYGAGLEDLGLRADLSAVPAGEGEDGPQGGGEGVS